MADAKILAHPLRVPIITAIAQADEHRASPSEIAELLGEPLGNISYHVRQLHSLRLLKLVKKTPRRGAIEHHYSVVPAVAAAVAGMLERQATAMRQAAGEPCMYGVHVGGVATDEGWHLDGAAAMARARQLAFADDTGDEPVQLIVAPRDEACLADSADRGAVSA